MDDGRPGKELSDSGTPIDQVNGHPLNEQLAARFNGSIVVYSAMAPAS
jgi:hypothetical protein